MIPTLPIRRRAARRATLPAALTIALLTFALAGCGGSGGASSSSGSAASATGTTASVTTGASTGGVTAPGTSLAVGQTATVLYQTTTSSGKPGANYKLKVTVVSIERGKLSDFNGVQLNASEKAGTPTYVQVRLTNLGPGALNTTGEDDPAAAVQGIDDTGQEQQSITFIGEFPRCPEKTTPKPFAQGQSLDTCLTFLVPGGIAKVAYTGTESYIGSPVTWKAG